MDKVIDKLFLRFREKGFDTSTLNKQEWIEELRVTKLEFFRYGISNSTELPSARQFKEMCNPLYTKKVYKPVDHKEWARKIIRDHAGGLTVKPICLKFARDALRIKEEI